MWAKTLYDEAFSSTKSSHAFTFNFGSREVNHLYFFVYSLDQWWVTASYFVESCVFSVPKSFLKAFFRSSVRVRLRDDHSV